MFSTALLISISDINNITMCMNIGWPVREDVARLGIVQAKVSIVDLFCKRYSCTDAEMSVDR